MIRSTISNLCKLAFVTFCLFPTSAAIGATPHDPKIVKYVDKALDIMERHSIMRNVIDWEKFREITFERASEQRYVGRSCSDQGRSDAPGR